MNPSSMYLTYRFYLISAIAIMLFFGKSVQAQIFVDQQANGLNDGSSWNDAYTELADALDAYNPGDEIWVAAGTYLPQQPAAWTGAAKQTFYLYQDVQIYGGFDGTETTRAARNPTANPTILSGDLNADDIPGDFDQNRTDNVINVVYVDSTITNATVLDGFTISGGYADIDDGIFTNKRGAGLFSYGPIQIAHCVFRDNYTIWHGGGIYFYQVHAAGASVDSCLFTENTCLNFGAGLMVAAVVSPGLTVTNSQFIDNESTAGAGMHVLNTDAILLGNLFSGNRAERGGGFGLLFNTGGPGNQVVSIKDCDFMGNYAETLGGGCSYDAASTTGNQVSLEGCQFVQNTSGFGGGFRYLSQSTQNCKLIFKGCSFLGNQAIITPANPLPSTGGVILQYHTPMSQQDTIRMEDCLIQDNSSAASVGGLYYVHSYGSDNHLLMDHCQLIGNRDSSGLGVAAIAVTEGGSNISVKVQRTLFDDNNGPFIQAFGVTRGLGIPAPQERKIELRNCVLTNHASDAATGAVLGTDQGFRLTNCTITGNQTPVLTTDEQGQIQLVNTILDGGDHPTYIATGTAGAPPIQSLGGNLFSDTLLTDQMEDTDVYKDAVLYENGTFALSENSPAVDAGTMLANPDMTDYLGNDRIQGNAIDIGAIESPYLATPTSIIKSLAHSIHLTTFPNPATNKLNLSLENEWQGKMELVIINELGQTVMRDSLTKIGSKLERAYNIESLATGTYRIWLRHKNGVATATILKEG